MKITITKIHEIDNYISYSINSSKVIVKIDCDTGVTLFTIQNYIHIDTELVFTACTKLIEQWKINTTLPNTLSWSS